MTVLGDFTCLSSSFGRRIFRHAELKSVGWAPKFKKRSDSGSVFTVLLAGIAIAGAFKFCFVPDNFRPARLDVKGDEQGQRQGADAIHRHDPHREILPPILPRVLSLIATATALSSRRAGAPVRAPRMAALCPTTSARSSPTRGERNTAIASGMSARRSPAAACDTDAAGARRECARRLHGTASPRHQRHE